MSVVLIAEDEPAVLEVLCDVIADLGHEPVRAIDGAEALALTRARRPALVITDYMMPRLSGLEFVLALRGDPALRSTRVILMSAARPAGAVAVDAFLAKPFDVDAIERLVTSILTTAPDKPDLVLAATTDAARPGVDRDALLAWIAHEIRTPLSAAKMHLQRLERLDVLVAEAARKHLSVALRQLEKMQALSTSLLDAARMRDGRMKLELHEHDLAATLRAVVDEWQEAVPDAHVVLALPAGAPPALPFDDVRVRQILDNLIGNALKHGDAARTVTVTVTATAPADHVVVEVSDDGRGIAPDELPHVFEPFRAAGNDGRAHGLGLSIAAELARLHGGSLSVRSTPGQGATFALELPRPR